MNRPAELHRLGEKTALQFRVVNACQHTRMACRKRAFDDSILNTLRQIEQTQNVGDGTAAAPDAGAVQEQTKLRLTLAIRSS